MWNILVDKIWARVILYRSLSEIFSYAKFERTNLISRILAKNIMSNSSEKYINWLNESEILVGRSWAKVISIQMDVWAIDRMNDSYLLRMCEEILDEQNLN